MVGVEQALTEQPISALRYDLIKQRLRLFPSRSGLNDRPAV